MCPFVALLRSLTQNACLPKLDLTSPAVLDTVLQICMGERPRGDASLDERAIRACAVRLLQLGAAGEAPAEGDLPRRAVAEVAGAVMAALRRMPIPPQQ